MASRFGFQKAWLSDSSAYPIVAVIGGACTLTTLFFGRTIIKNPDVSWNKYDRSQPIQTLFSDPNGYKNSCVGYASHRGGFARVGSNEITENRDAAYAEGKGSIFKVVE